MSLLLLLPSCLFTDAFDPLSCEHAILVEIRQTEGFQLCSVPVTSRQAQVNMGRSGPHFLPIEQTGLKCEVK